MNYLNLEDVMLSIKREVKVKMEAEEVALHDLAGRMLAEDIISQIDIPPHPRSLVDGYAVRARDTATASQEDPVTLPVKGRIELEMPSGVLKDRGAYYIPTGGYLPEGADAVVQVEDVAVRRDDSIALTRRIQQGEHITPAGSDVSRNQAVFKRLRVIRPEDIALLAEMMIWGVRVVKKPKVAVLSIGDELTLDFREVRGGRKFAGINFTVLNLVVEAGAEAIQLGLAPDVEEEIEAKLRSGLNQADMILTIGGTSKGVKDLVARAIDRVGKPGLIIHGVNLVPGRVSGFGVVDGKPIVMLPGLIQSTVAAFYFVALPTIRLMQGLRPEPDFITVRAKMAEKISFPRREFRKLVFVKLLESNGETLAKPISKLGEASLMRTVVEADGFITIPEGAESIDDGVEVKVKLLHPVQSGR